jgi:hypothetical protein
MSWSNQRNKELEKQMERDFHVANPPRFQRPIRAMPQQPSVPLPATYAYQTHVDLSADERAFVAEYEQEIVSPTSASNDQSDIASILNTPQPSRPSSSPFPPRRVNGVSVTRPATAHSSRAFHVPRVYVNEPRACLQETWRPGTEEIARFGTKRLGAVGEASGPQHSTTTTPPADSSSTASFVLCNGAYYPVFTVPSTEAKLESFRQNWRQDFTTQSKGKTPAAPVLPPRPFSLTSSIRTDKPHRSQPSPAIGVYASPPSPSTPLRPTSSTSSVKTVNPYHPQPPLPLLSTSGVYASPPSSSSTPSPPPPSATPMPIDDRTATQAVEFLTFRLWHELQKAYTDYLTLYLSTITPYSHQKDFFAISCWYDLNTLLTGFMNEEYVKHNWYWGWDCTGERDVREVAWDCMGERVIYDLLYRRWADYSSLFYLTHYKAVGVGRKTFTTTVCEEGMNMYGRTLPAIFNLRLALFAELRDVLFYRRSLLAERSHSGLCLEHRQEAPYFPAGTAGKNTTFESAFEKLDAKRALEEQLDRSLSEELDAMGTNGQDRGLWRGNEYTPNTDTTTASDDDAQTRQEAETGDGDGDGSDSATVVSAGGSS